MGRGGRKRRWIFFGKVEIIFETEMKICIVGPSCVGKTTLSKRLAKKLKVPAFDLDKVFIDFEFLKKTKQFRFVSSLVYKDRIEKILSRKGWVIEGVFPVEKVFEKADAIVFLIRPVWVPLLWQWKRYLTDGSQRRDFGFKNNWILSKDIVRQYLQKKGLEKTGDPTFFNLFKTSQMLKKYKRKIYEINCQRDERKIVDKLSFIFE